MKSHLILVLAAAFVALTFFGAHDRQSLPGQEKTPPRSAWTLDEAMAQLRLYPKDPFLQYVALQLARRENSVNDVATQIEQLAGTDARFQRNERANRVDLFSIFTGALAVQESLQLDSMRGEGRRTPRGVSGMPKRMSVERKIVPAEREAQAAEEKRLKQLVPVASLTGPTTKSHPWEQMLAGKKVGADIGQLALCVPDDFYFVEFHSVNRLLDAIDLGNLGSNYFFNQASKEAQTHLTGERVKSQLAVETNRLLRPFYDLVVEEVGVTGSDLFVNEGSDVTLLFKLKDPKTFKMRMDQFLVNVEKNHPDAKRTTGRYRGVEYVHLATPDRMVHVFSAYPKDHLHVRSNSLVAFQRILDAIEGQPAETKTGHRLGETPEFAYIRTLLPRGAAEEDGLVYLSDPFIRRLVGPQLKLTERRRMMCYNHLRMIGHAALLYRAEHGKAPGSLEALAKAECSPGTFGEGSLTCPDGGKYSLSADGLTGVCSHHGHAHFLTPCCEIGVTEVTGEEADEYKAFLQEYNQYWRTFFDPIAVRIQARPERYRIETIVLPLIDNSIYTGLAQFLGGKPERLDALPVPKRNIFTVAARLNKESLLRQSGLEETPSTTEQNKGLTQKRHLPTGEEIRCTNNLRQIGLALFNYHDTYGKFPAIANFDKAGKPLLSWRVHILPFMEHQDLYQEFHLDEPWDSEHNKKLIPRMPGSFRCPSSKTKDPGRTTYLAPVGKNTMFTGDSKQLRVSDVTDGLSNTIFIVDAADDNARIWTKPEDLNYDPEKPLAGLTGHHPGIFASVFGDGSVHLLRDTIDPNTLRGLFTRNQGEVLQLPDETHQPDFGPGNRGWFGLPQDAVDGLKLKEFLSRGIGNQIGLNLYDAVQLVDVNVPAALGMALGTFNGRNAFANSETILIGFLAASVNSPAYVSIPVKDPKIVEDFLSRLDSLLLETARQRETRGMFFGVEPDFYLPLEKDNSIRTLGIQFGPVKWRLFWARVGDGLYIASKRFILEDLQKTQSVARGDSGPAAHGMIRVRPGNWDQVLPDFRLSWAENNREACLNNLGPLSSISRALTESSADRGERRVPPLAERLLGAHAFCPEGGHYVVSPDGKQVRCTVHGDAHSPRQPIAPADGSPSNKLLRNFTGITITLTFLEDGLHAVATIDRK
jgi:hypothetical protein